MDHANLTIAQWIKQAKQQIAALDADLIALKAFAPREADRSWLISHGEQKINPRALQLANLMLQKRMHGVPLAYVIEKKEFYGRPFLVKPGVLIPRPETETIIDVAKSLELPPRPRFLEIGTGSGCIAVTLALEFAQSYVLATDLSTKALRIAEYNDIQHEGRIELVQSNLLRDLDFEGNSACEPEHFDVLVANLPYVNRDWDWLNLESLAFEPPMALFAKGNNGLSLYQRFFKELYYQRNLNSLWLDYVIVEADPCQHVALTKMAERSGFIHLRTEGYVLLFEDKWRYWLDTEQGKFIEHKPKEILDLERKTGVVHWLPEQIDHEDLL